MHPQKENTRTKIVGHKPHALKWLYAWKNIEKVL